MMLNKIYNIPALKRLALGDKVDTKQIHRLVNAFVRDNALEYLKSECKRQKALELLVIIF